MSKETVVEVVKMEDGREVPFAGKKRLVKNAKVQGGDIVVTLDFRNGRTLHYTMSEGMVLEFAAHGALQKLGDVSAGEKDIDNAILVTESLIEQLNKGEFNAQREANSMAGTSVLLRALVEYKGKSVEEVKAFLASKSQADKMALRNNERIKPIIKRIEAERAAKASKVDTEIMLDELGA